MVMPTVTKSISCIAAINCTCVGLYYTSLVRNWYSHDYTPALHYELVVEDCKHYQVEVVPTQEIYFQLFMTEGLQFGNDRIFIVMRLRLWQSVY